MPIFKNAKIMSVWEENFQEAADCIKKVIGRYRHISIATRSVRFPAAPTAASSGATPSSSSATPSSSSAAAAASSSRAVTPDHYYAYLRQQSNIMRPIQVGLSFCDKEGYLAKHPVTQERCIWEFNIKVARSIEEIDASLRKLLEEQDLPVDFNVEKAIRPEDFCRGLFNPDILLKTEMLLTNPIHWVVFRGTTNFSWILKFMREDKQLPQQRLDFLGEVNMYFPKFYEVRKLMAFRGLSGTMSEVAAVLGVNVPEGEKGLNMAGPDSLLTISLVSMIIKNHYQEGIPQELANSMLLLS